MHCICTYVCVVLCVCCWTELCCTYVCMPLTAVLWRGMDGSNAVSVTAAVTLTCMGVFTLSIMHTWYGLSSGVCLWLWIFPQHGKSSVCWIGNLRTNVAGFVHECVPLYVHICVSAMSVSMCVHKYRPCEQTYIGYIHMYTQCFRCDSSVLCYLCSMATYIRMYVCTYT